MEKLPDQDTSISDCAAVVLANWRTELVTLKQTALQKVCPERPILEFSPEGIRVIELDEQCVETFIPIENAGAAVAARRLSQHFRGKKVDVCLSVPDRYVLRPHVALPHVSNRSLNEALRFEVERLCPIDPKDVFFDFIRLSNETEPGLTEVELRIVRKQDVATSIEVCRHVGLEVTAIKLGNDALTANRASFSILPLAFWRSEFRRLLVPILLFAVCLLLIIVIAGTYWRASVAQHRLTDSVVEAGIRAARVEQLQSRINRTAFDLSLPTQKKKEAPLLIQTISELSRALPDDTWVSQLALDGSKVRIQGVSGSASALLGRIDRSPLFANAEFVAPVVHEQNTSGDHFDIAFDVRSKPQ